MKTINYELIFQNSPLAQTIKGDEGKQANGTNTPYMTKPSLLARKSHRNVYFVAWRIREEG